MRKLGTINFTPMIEVKHQRNNIRLLANLQRPCCLFGVETIARHVPRIAKLGLIVNLLFVFWVSY